MNNGYFRKADKALIDVAGHQLDWEWWSRPYEYAWALEQCRGMQTVADMGTGWMERPFKHGLVLECGTVYAVDADPRVLALPNPTPQRLHHLCGNFTQGPITGIGESELDGVFCISVLEDVRPEKLADTLTTFDYHLKDGGVIVLTFDVLTGDKMLYPGMDFDALEDAMRASGLWYIGDVDYTLPADAVRHNGWNLAVFHALVGRAK